jgi:hypothetical protein
MKIRTLNYGSTRRWAFWRKMILRRADGIAYLDRLRIVQTPWFGVYLHRMDAPDPGLDLHDHPWRFVSLVLRGGYDEYRTETRVATMFADLSERWPTTCTPGVVNVRKRGSIQGMRLDECHTIHRLHRTPTWTLMFVGRRVRGWGFYLPTLAEQWGYVPSEHYENLNRRELTYQEDA